METHTLKETESMSAETPLGFQIMKMEFKEKKRKRSSRIQPACPGCAMIKSEWPGEGYAHDGQMYCCQGCAEGTGCTCQLAAEPGFSREGQLATKAVPRPGEQRSGAPAPKGELSGERDDRGTEEAIDQSGHSTALNRG
jgi:hypothetical protein